MRGLIVMNNLDFLNDIDISMEDFIDTTNDNNNLDILSFKQQLQKQQIELHKKILQQVNFDNTFSSVIEVAKSNNNSKQEEAVSKYIYTDKEQNIHYIIDWENFEFLKKAMIDINTINIYLNKSKTSVDLHIYPSVDYIDSYAYYQYPIYDLFKYLILHLKINNIIGHFCRLYHTYVDLYLILKYTNKIIVDSEYTNLRILLKKERVLLKDLYWEEYISNINKAVKLGLIDKNEVDKGIKDFGITIYTNIIKK